MSEETRLARLRQMPAAELVTRARAAARVLVERATLAVATPRWHRPQLRRALDPRHVAAAVDRLAGGDWNGAHRALLAHVRSRETAFLLTPSQRLRTAAQVVSAHPAARGDAAARAARVLGGDYDLLGHRGLHCRDADGRPDWHADPVSARRAPQVFWADVPYLDPGSGDHKVIWELNRHQHWLVLGRAWWLTGDPACRRAFVEEFGTWLDANPPLVGINWASALEIAFRTLSWLWALHFFADEPAGDEPPWSVDLLLALDRQLRHLERHLSWYFSPNTHLLGEGLALYVCGTVLPELRGSRRWTVAGRQVLLSEATRQVLADGAHAERSPHYHRYALDFYLLALAVARLAGDAALCDALVPVVDRMATWMQRVADVRGRLPLIGDDDGGELFPIAGTQGSDARLSLGWAADLLDRPDLRIDPVPEAVTWLTLHPRTRHARAVRDASPRDAGAAAPEISGPETSGYVVLRRGEMHLLFDGGPHGFLNGGHAHADALALTLTAAGEPLLIDPGTATYTMDPAVRDRFRSSAMHNTLVLDGRSQATPRGPFHWATTADGRIARAVHTRRFDYVRGETDAWAPHRHARHLLAIADDTWIVADEVLGAGTHEIAVHWHVAPEWEARPDGWAVGFAHPRGVQAHVAVPGARVTVLHGDREPGLGWVAPVYGRVEPAPTVQARVTGALPCWVPSIITVNAPGTPHEVARLEVQATESPGASLAVLHRRGPDTEVTLVRGAATQGMATLALGPHGSLATDARVLHARLGADGRLARLAAVDVTAIRCDGPGSFRLSAPRLVPDLWIRARPGGPPAVESTTGTDDLAFDAETRRPSPAVTARREPSGHRPAAASS